MMPNRANRWVTSKMPAVSCDQPIRLQYNSELIKLEKAWVMGLLGSPWPITLLSDSGIILPIANAAKTNAEPMMYRR